MKVSLRPLEVNRSPFRQYLGFFHGLEDLTVQELIFAPKLLILERWPETPLFSITRLCMFRSLALYSCQQRETNPIETMGAVAVVPCKSNHKQQRSHDKTLYRQRNRIERCFSRLKHFRRFATRYEKLKTNFQALVALACSWLHLQLYVDTA